MLQAMLVFFSVDLQLRIAAPEPPESGFGGAFGNRRKVAEKGAFRPYLLDRLGPKP